MEKGSGSGTITEVFKKYLNAALEGTVSWQSFSIIHQPPFCLNQFYQKHAAVQGTFDRI